MMPEVKINTSLSASLLLCPAHTTLHKQKVGNRF